MKKQWSDVFRVAGVTAITVAAAGCSGDMSRFSSGSFFTASTDNQRAIIDGAPADTMVTGSVPPAGGVVTAAPLPPASTQAATYAPASAQQPTAVASYKGWTATGGTIITVGQGETLAGVSRRYGVPSDAILSTNRIASAAEVVPGKQIIIPVYSVGGAAVASAAPATAPAGGPPATHKVVPGDTLLSISRAYGVPSSSIAQANNLSNGNSIRIGQTLRIPGGTSTATQMASLQPQTLNDAAAKMPESRPATPKPEATSPVATQQLTPPTQPAPGAPTGGTQVASLPTMAAGAGKTATDAAAQGAETSTEEDMGSGFRWPARGRIISGFGRKTNGEQNDGINIALPEGSPIKASEAGVVIYAGNELTGFGNLVLIRHDNGWVTAYAHNQDILVSRNQQVKRGQVIAHAGATGSVSQPQLHFELRKGSQPVDPLPHLSGA